MVEPMQPNNRMHRLASLFFVSCAILFAHAAAAHEARPLFVEVIERAPGLFSVSWKTPPSVPAFNAPDVTISAGCRPNKDAVQSANLSSRIYRCDGGLSGETVGIAYPTANPSVSTLIRLELFSGETRSVVLGPQETSWDVPAKETTASVAGEYLVLGVEHILKGYDHLLFVALLILIAGTWRRVLVTITGFTISHSATLALAALDVLRLPVVPVEATIALSIVFVATELARDRRDTLTWRYPISVSSSFGLLHGFGFASVLSEIGLPQTEIPAALLFFNVGVEIGQIVFILGVATLAWLVHFGRSRKREGLSIAAIQALVSKPAAYVVGSLAIFWFVDRLQGFVPV